MMREIHTSSGRTWVDDEGIMHVAVNDGAEQTLAHAEEYLVARRALSNGRAFPLLVNLKGIKSLSRQARQRYAAPDCAETAYAVAMVYGSPLSRMIGNFFLGMNHMPVPMRLFGSQREAKAWLLAQTPRSA